MIVIKVLSLILWLFAVPFCIGVIRMGWIAEEKRGIGVALAAGYFIMLPLCWLVTVPCILLVKYDSFLVMVRWFTGALALAYGLIKKGIRPLVFLFCSAERWDGRRRPGGLYSSA